MRRGPLCKGKERARGQPSTPRDAVEWYVEIDARPQPDETMRARWKRWMLRRANRVQYAEVALLGCELRESLPPPTATRGELLEDAAAERREP